MNLISLALLATVRAAKNSALVELHAVMVCVFDSQAAVHPDDWRADPVTCLLFLSLPPQLVSMNPVDCGCAVFMANSPCVSGNRTGLWHFGSGRSRTESLPQVCRALPIQGTWQVISSCAVILLPVQHK